MGTIIAVSGRTACFEFGCVNDKCVNFSMLCNGVEDCGDRSDEKLCGMYCSTCVVGLLLLLGSQCEAYRGNVTSESCKAGILVGGGFVGGVVATIIVLAAILLVKKW